MARLAQDLPVSRAGSAMEVDSTEGEDAATEPMVSTTKSALAQADAVTREDIPLRPKDAAGMGAADPPSEMDEDDESRRGNGETPSTLRRGDGADPVTGTGGLEHLVPRGVAREAAFAKMAYKKPKESLIELLLEL